MKLQYLIVIFLLIIIPMLIVYSAFISGEMKTLKTEIIYNTKLLNATYDAIKAYQLNTINNATSDVQSKKVDDLEAAARVFLNSISTSFGYDGYRANEMQEYIPAVVFTLYDGYYIYAPFKNDLKYLDEGTEDESYKRGKILYDLKPYVYYSCRYSYTKNGKKSDFVITYTLDNYITIDGIVNEEYVYDYGYIIGRDSLKKEDGKLKFDGVEIPENEEETLYEYIGNDIYKYVKINGRKYYWNESGRYIFFIGDDGEEHKQAYNDLGDSDESKRRREIYQTYVNLITKNNYGYLYYKEAYEFTDRVLNEYGLIDLKVSDIYGYNDKKDYFITSGKIFDGRLHESDSKFNQHRKEVIRYAIETNLKVSITEFKQYSQASKDIDFIMPKISETDWEMLTNNVCIATFLQGFNIGSKIYNGYSVVANNLNKEYVDENYIYMLTQDGEYTRVNDKNLLNENSIPNKDTTHNLSNGNLNNFAELSYYPGRLNIDFENKVDLRSDISIKYTALKYKTETSNIPYYGSYTGLIGSSSLNDFEDLDMYKYMRGETGINFNNDAGKDLRKAYYISLGRERKSSYHVNNKLMESSRSIYLQQSGMTNEPEIEVIAPQPSVADGAVTFSTNYGTIDVIWLSGTTNKVLNKPNAPVLEGMTPVKWTETADGWNGTHVGTTTSDPDWYNYNAVSTRDSSGKTIDNTTSKWANAINSDGSYFVWIPRFAYRITYYENEESTEPTGYYDGYGQWRASDGKLRLALDEGIKTVLYNGKNYIVHPAFCGEDVGYDNGSWDKDITGFWVAKYEMSRSGDKFLSLPNVEYENDEENIGKMYTSAQNYDKSKESHLIKNSEWGAVAYLTYSQYGRNGNEIDMNNTKITGNGGGSPNNAYKKPSYAYNTKKGAGASTTGNIYGIYDMSGRLDDCVAAFNNADSNNYELINGESFASTTGLSTKYATKYYNKTSRHIGNTRIYTYGKIGDATKETYSGGKDAVISENYNYSWGSIIQNICSSSDPFITRGSWYAQVIPGIGSMGARDGRSENINMHSV